MERITITSKEAAQYLGISVDTLYMMVREKELPVIKARGKFLFRVPSLNDWMARQEQINEQEVI